jgi:hypothetical protein
VRKNGLHIGVQTIAPFPPALYDIDWYNALDFAETTNYVVNFVNYKVREFFNSESFLSTPDLSKVVKIVNDIHARYIPNIYTMSLITQETNINQLMWRCMKEQRVHTINTTNYNYYTNVWRASENVYKYKASNIYFGGKNYSGPLNSILYDAADGVTYSEHAILDLNEFPINSNNEVFVYDYISNYSTSSPKVYCVLNKITGRMAEIDVNAKTVKYFTLVVPNDCEIVKLYFTNRLMYTIKSIDNTSLILYDANNNGVLLHIFDLGTYDPSVIPQFTVIN